MVFIVIKNRSWGLYVNNNRSNHLLITLTSHITYLIMLFNGDKISVCFLFSWSFCFVCEKEMSSGMTDIQLKSENEGTAANNQLRFQTYKNLLVISFAFLLQFTAFGGIDKLQSSLNAEANVGVNSLSIIYASLILSSIFLPHPLISILGLKWTIVICQIPWVKFLSNQIESGCMYSFQVCFIYSSKFLSKSLSNVSE